jgi:hypothetical protein
MASFRGEKFFLSNMFPCPFSLNGITYNTSEHYFQAHLASSLEHAQAILITRDGWAAKRLARTLPRKMDYKSIQVEVMSQALYFKFLAYPDLRAKLLATPDDELLEENEWHDNFWGRCTCATCRQKGGYRNTLGMLLRLTKNYFATIQAITFS